MIIEYGPPGAAGVKQLQYVGDDADYTSVNLEELAKPVGKLALGTYGYAWVTGNRSLKVISLGVMVGAFLVRLGVKPK